MAASAGMKANTMREMLHRLIDDPNLLYYVCGALIGICVLVIHEDYRRACRELDRRERGE
jgi:hypothetical protein